MIYPWKLDFWQSGEWQVINERLKGFDKAGVVYNPKRAALFRALSLTSLEQTKVVVLGQDPYPDPKFATGLSFSIPRGIGQDSFPPTLRTLFKEYCSDLHYSFPSHGDLTIWATQGVLLWNAIPSCRAGKSLSHDWPGNEWCFLTKEIIERCSRKGIVFALLGTVAKRYLEFIDLSNNEVIFTSHPSPRGSRNSRTPFEGSRLFSTINDKLHSQGLTAIDWRLDDVQDQRDKGNSKVLKQPGRIWDSNRSVSWVQGKDTSGIRDHGRLVVHE
jgi:uracil-DNA glycosylase